MLAPMCCSGDCWEEITDGLYCLILGFPFGIESMSCFDFLLQKQSVALYERGSAADNLGTCFDISFQKQSEGLRIQNLL